MKKIIAAFDGLKFFESTLDYTIYLAKRCNAHLVGVFLDDFTYNATDVAREAADIILLDKDLSVLAEERKNH